MDMVSHGYGSFVLQALVPILNGYVKDRVPRGPGFLCIANCSSYSLRTKFR